MSRWGKKIVSVLCHCSSVILERRPFPFSSLRNVGKDGLGSELRFDFWKSALWNRRDYDVILTLYETKPSKHALQKKNKRKTQNGLGSISAYYVLIVFLILFQWLVVLILLVLTNALWMYRRRTRRRIHRISSIRDARPRVFSNDEMN